ncbi:WhiB family transcriptional regulator [Corynebacterium aquilae]|uniref:Transcriptional regulator WhiB n=1 Tax=Corynebacterium aquilae DSM 44791 TaxID=1431546 RepID=A0A1L7CDF7_9CORY|nr:WhiB family transcriptional regulator [Corynebacterium aquilae]APT83868.1 hypothetical protein CAQU_00845 [Corynebacterium aquilae DSM 44791]
MTASLTNTKNNPYLSASTTTVEPAKTRGDWVTQAKCRDGDPDALFVRGAAQRRAAQICRRCPVVDLCRADALDNKVEFGVWGGLTERQRRALLRANPDVTDWAAYFERHGDELLGV